MGDKCAVARCLNPAAVSIDHLPNATVASHPDFVPAKGGGDPQCVCDGRGGVVRAAALQLRADRVDSSVERELGAGQLPREDQGQQGGKTRIIGCLCVHTKYCLVDCLSAVHLVHISKGSMDVEQLASCREFLPSTHEPYEYRTPL